MTGVIKSGALFVQENFLDKEFTREIRREIDDARQYSTPLQDVEKRIERKDPPKGRPKSAFDISKPLQNKLEKRSRE